MGCLKSLFPWVLVLAVPAAGPVGAAAPSPTWLDAVEERLAELEYRASWQEATGFPDLEAAWQAPNRAQNLRAWFTEQGVRLVPRTGNATWELSLSLARWGRPGLEQDAAPARVSPRENRVDYERDGAIAEWYVNDERGLEQLFRIDLPPAANAGERGPVHLDVAIGGDLTPIVASDRQAIDLATPSGVRVLRIAGLVVTDASGRELPSSMNGFVDSRFRGLRLTYDDTDALYPVTVDPLITSPNWTVESNQASARTGGVATAGDVNGDGYSDVLVAASGFDNGHADEGRVELYLGSPAGLSTNPSWTVEGQQTSAALGGVATAGDVNGDGYSDVIVSSTSYDNDQTDEGRAWVYHGSAAGLSSTPSWTAEGNQALPLFGASIGCAGDVNGDGYSDVHVSAPWADGPTGFNEGAVYVYHGSASGLAASSAWVIYGGVVQLSYGAIASAGDVNGDGYADVVTGAYLHSTGEIQEGKVDLFLGSPSGLAASPAWTHEGNQSFSGYGAVVGTAGDVNADGYSDVFVGAFNWDVPWTNEGAVFVYHGSAAGLGASHAWTASGGQTSANFGSVAATAGDWNGDGYADLIVGSSLYDNGVTDEGAAFLYLGSASGLHTTADFTMESDQLQAQFGSSVGTAGDVNGDGFSDVVVGASRYDNGQTDEGRAYVYYGSAGPPNAIASWSREGNDVDPGYGEALTLTGDVHGDGFADLVVGVPRWDAGGSNAGAIFLFAGSVNGPGIGPNWWMEGEQEAAFFGRSVGVGDVDGDGYGDVLVGAPLNDTPAVDAGRVFLYHSGPGGPAVTPAWTADGQIVGERFGWSVSEAGDVNGDGYADVMVGAPHYDNGQTNEGRVYAYYGTPSGLPAAPSWMVESNQASTGFGETLSTAGDVNGDGYSDVILGAWAFDNGQTDEGRAFVYHGSSAGLLTSPSWTAESDQASARFGTAAGTAGDVNRDGYSDVIVGAPGFDNGQTDEGAVSLYLGSPVGLAPGAASRLEVNQASASFGQAVATAGDVDGDGYSDVLAGAPGYSNGQAAEGRAMLYRGSAAGLATSPSWTVESGQASANMGTAVAGGGDVNGDAYVDLVVTTGGWDNEHFNEGRVSLFFGNGAAGFRSMPQQTRTLDTRRIPRLGASDATDGFGMSLVGKNPFGRGPMRLETEVKPLGTPFDGTATTVGPIVTDIDSPGELLSATATGLAGSTPYHWRARVLFDPVTTPFAQHGPWLSPAWNGAGETDLRTADASAAGRVAQVTIGKAGGLQITLVWQPSCDATDGDYEVYEGVLGDFTSHEPRYCTTSGATSKTFTPIGGNTYYLVVPSSGVREGSYGATSDDVERGQGQGACLPQQLAVCP